MRVSKTLSAVVLVSLVASATTARAVDPVADGQPIDSLIATVLAKRKAVADAQRTVEQARTAQATAEAELKSAVDALNKQIADLGLGVPTPTPPADPLTAKLQAAYRADPAATKADDLLTLAELMKAAGSLADDSALTTVGQLASKVAAAAGTLAKDRLAGVRAILKIELAAAFPEDKPLTADVRAAAKATFSRLQTALTEAGK
jgi:hypothetical protein